MNGRERTRAAIDHKEGDRPPYLIHMCDETWKMIQDAAAAGSPDDYLDNDIATIAPPWWRWHELGGDWRTMDVPVSPARVMGYGDYEKFSETVKRIAGESGKYIQVQIYGSHFEKAYFSRGIENFLADMAGEPEFARKLLNKIIEKNMVMLDSFLAIREIDGVLLGSDWGSQLDLLMSPDIWFDMIAPGEKKEYDLIHSYDKDVWVHSCGNIERIIPALIDMGLNVLNPIQPEAMDIARLKKEYGDKLTFWGGISTQQTLPYGNPQEVEREARAVRDMMAVEGGYIFAPAQSIQDDVPWENIEALLKVAREPWMKKSGKGEG